VAAADLGMNYNTASYFNPQQQDETSFFATKKQHLMVGVLLFSFQFQQVFFLLAAFLLN
jgi:hypothetical protein